MHFLVTIAPVDSVNFMRELQVCESGARHCVAQHPTHPGHAVSCIDPLCNSLSWNLSMFCCYDRRSVMAHGQNCDIMNAIQLTG